MFLFDSYYFILVVPALLLSLYAQYKVKGTFNKYSKLRNINGLTGSQVAKQILDISGIYDVSIEPVRGNLTDHYDPRKKVLRLSESVHNSTSVSAVGVAAHEVGHAIQHNVGYQALALRSGILPIANIGSSIGPILAIVGLIFNSGFLLQIGIILFSFAVLFLLITLPVEFNASSRAISVLESNAILSPEEITPAKKVLGAAAMTYVASAIVAIMSLLRLILLANSRD